MFKKKRKSLRTRLNYGRRPLSTTRFTGHNRTRIKTPSRIFKKIKRLSFLVIFLIFIIFLIYIIAFSDYFLFKKVRFPKENIENENLSMQIEEGLKNYLGENLVFLETNDLESMIIEKIAELEQVSISKNYPDALEIEFLEHPLVANVINESTNLKKSYVVNSVGYAVKEDLENTTLPYIKIKSEETLNLNSAIIETGKLSYILDAITYFEDKFGMRIVEVEYKKTAREVHLFTEKNFYVWLDIQVPFEDQLKKLKKALVKLDIFTEPFAYIDLRIAGNNGDKIIYKRR